MPTDPLSVQTDEFGFLRIFALDREEIVTQRGVANLIGALVDPEKVEVVDTKDVSALGLATYLVEGYGLDAEDIADETEALNAIDGHVVLIPTSAFGGEEVHLNPSPPLRFIGLYAEAEATPPMPRVVARSFELPELEPQDEPRTEDTKRASSRVVILISLLLAAAIVGYLFL